MKTRKRAAAFIAAVLFSIQVTTVRAIDIQEEPIIEEPEVVEIYEEPVDHIHIVEPYEESVVLEYEEQEDFENELIEKAILANANVKNNVKITFYCMENYSHICNDGDPSTTASGEPRIPWATCAADDIPLGSTVMIDFNNDGEIDQYLVCNDRFGGGRKNAIDICVSTHQEALDCGVRYATVYWEAV